MLGAHKKHIWDGMQRGILFSIISRELYFIFYLCIGKTDCNFTLQMTERHREKKCGQKKSIPFVDGELSDR